MNLPAAALLPALLSAWLPPQQPATTPAATEPPLAYKIDVQLQPAEHTLVGTQQMRWRNTATAPVGELRLHLYWNAFRDRESTYMREAGALRSAWSEAVSGGIDIDSVALLDGALATPLAHDFAQPDDGNTADRTVLRVVLPSPVTPGESITVAIGFRCRLPKALSRWGWLPGGGSFCMHFHPSLGVLQSTAAGPQWNCHQFHANCEFFGEYARYEVTLTVPSRCVVGATGGNPVEETTIDGERRRLVFRQDDVHEFAFVADPNFAVVNDTFGPLGDLPQTQIRLLLQPAHDTEAHRQRYLAAVKTGLEFFGRRFGPYPYGVITAVDPGADAEGRQLGGGMEYPMLITLGAPLLLHRQELEPEGVTVHEFGHQFWYGLCGNNEFEESWLDEGINTYCTGRAEALGYASKPLLASGTPMQPCEVSRIGGWPLAASRGPFVAADELALRRDLPLVWRIPGWHVAAALGFRASWRPASPLLDLLAWQPAATWFPQVPCVDAFADRDAFLQQPTADPMVRDGWRYSGRGSYGVNSYVRPATILRTLERAVDSQDPGRWWAFLREFHQTFRLRHPTTSDFEELLQKRCGDAALGYFRSAAAAGAVLDYGIDGTPEQRDGRTSVRVRRYGTLPAAVTVRCTFEHGVETRAIAADDLAAVHEFEFVDAAGQARGRLLEVWVDPPVLPKETEEPLWPVGIHLLDADLTNNAWRAAAQPGPARHRALRALLQSQCALTFAGAQG
jgi:hypothetical protein